MSERLSSLGGHLEVRPSARGFHLLASVPGDAAGLSSAAPSAAVPRSAAPVRGAPGCGAEARAGEVRGANVAQ